jgi:outer membrane cobalamin receptor
VIRTRFSPLLLSLSLVLSAGALAAPAAIAATIRGRVTDPDGRVVPQARVLVLAGATIVATADTDARGSFVVLDLPAGDYTIAIDRDGFRAEPLAVRVAADDDRAVALALRLSAVTESVVVSAAQADLPRSRVPASLTIVTADDLRAQQAETVAAALARVPGLSVQQSGGRGAITSIFPRGGESNYTLVLVDGVPVNAFGGDIDLAHLGTAGVERLEVVRGPQSAVHGGGAIGAVVQIVTANGGSPALEGSVEGGSLDTARLAVSTRGTRGAWSWGAAGERLTTDGYTGAAPATGEIVSNDDYRASHLILSGRWSGPRRSDVRADVRMDEGVRGYPGPYGSDPAGMFPGVDRISRGTSTTRSYAVTGAFDWTPRLRPAVHVSYADLDGSFESPYGPSTSASGRFTSRAQIDWTASPSLGLSFGAEALRERAESSFITGAQFEPVPIRRGDVGAFAEARYERDTRLFVVAGVRVERIHRDALEGDASPFAPRPDFPAETHVAATPRLSASFYLQPASARARAWTKLHGSAASGIRPPDAFEIAFTDNPSLRPERSRSVDAGVEQALAGGLVVLDATAFVNRYDDLIVAVGRSLADASQFRTDNIANARAAGLEVSASLRTAYGLAASVAYTFLDTEILAVDGLPEQAPPPFEPGDPLIRRPRHQASFDLTLTRSRVTAFARVGGRGRMTDVEPNLGAFGGLFTAHGYVAADAGASIRVTRALEVFGRITNLFDRRYEETLGYPALPRAAVMGVRVALRD